MERLSIDEVIEHCKRHTERMESHSGRSQLEETPIGNSNIMKQYWEHRQVAEWLEQLKNYKDAEEQGLLLRLPYPLGTENLYFADKDDWYVLDARKIQAQKMPDGKILFEIDCFEFWAEDFGKIVFLTREEAEQALEAMKGGAE